MISQVFTIPKSASSVSSAVYNTFLYDTEFSKRSTLFLYLLEKIEILLRAGLEFMIEVVLNGDVVQGADGYAEKFEAVLDIGVLPHRGGFVSFIETVHAEKILFVK